MPTCKAWKDIAPSTSAPGKIRRAFWGELAERELDWFQKWNTVLDWSNPPFAKWFSGAKTNVSYNCIDRHLKGARRDKAAIIFEGEPGDQRMITYGELHSLVCRSRKCTEGAWIQSRRSVDHLHADDP